MRYFFFILLLAASVFAQKPDDVLATATGVTIKLSDLTPDTQTNVTEMAAKIGPARAALLDQMVSRRIFDAEAKARGVTMGKFLADEKAKVKGPTDAEIMKVIDGNQSQLASVPVAEQRRQVVAYLRERFEDKALGELYIQLKTKYKVTPGKDVNGKLLPTDIVVTVNAQPISAKMYEDFVQIPIYEAKAEIAEMVLNEIDNQLYSRLASMEAQALAIDSSELIRREVTSKFKDFSDVERFMIEDAFRTKLYEKYKVTILYTEPEVPRQVISADDDPATGPIAAPVKVIMFSDFQCSACAASHPVLKKVIAEFPGRVRFVVRDFPLETIHANAFDAAKAANAANAQGKYTEYIEILYKNQDAQDVASLKKYAAEIGLNAAKFELDFNSPATAAEVRKDLDDGESYAVNSTPTIFVNGVRIRNLTAMAFRSAIQRALRK